MQENKINTEFRIYEDPVDSSINTHKNNELLIVSIKNNSNTRIVFPPNHMRIFVLKNNQWELVENKMSYSETSKTLGTYDEFPLGIVEHVIPFVPNMTEDAPVLIFFDGYLQSTQEIVGAYLQFTLSP